MASANDRGLPPRPPVFDASGPPPLPPPDLSTFSAENRHMYTFRGDSYRPSDRSEPSYPQNDFSFRANSDAPAYPSGLPPTGPRAARRRKEGRNGREPRQQRNSGRGFVGPSDRPLLRSQRASTPEQLAGMSEENQSRFMIPEDVSDSSEDMELESDHDNDNDEVDVTPGSEDGPPRKKQALDMTDSNAIPKWSNPDPYTSLPPPDETQKKRKDFVKLIRKARVAENPSESKASTVANGEDFISLDFGDGGTLERDEEHSDGVVSVSGRGPPTGPKFSHLDNLHPDRFNIPPGTNGMSVTSSSLGPPPSSGVDDSRRAGPVDGKMDVWPPPDAESALGTRKRTHDDHLVNDQPSASGRTKRMNPNLIDGDVSKRWRPKVNQNSTPWCTVDHCSTDSMGLWLHKEICDFYEYARPRDFEDKIRTELVHRFRQAVRQKYSNADVHCFGSFAGGLYLPNADMDLVVVSSEFMKYNRKMLCQTKTKLYQFGHFLENLGIPVLKSVVVIAGARVPIVKYVDKITGLRVDVSFENDTGLIANQTFAQWKADFPAMPVIVSLIKQFLAMRSLNDVATGGLGGFSVTCLVTSLLQLMPERQSGNFLPELNLGMVLMQFLDLYGNEFDISTTAISLAPPRYVDKATIRDRPYNANRVERLHIIDPNNSKNDISGGSKNIASIFTCFKQAYDTIQMRLADLRRMDDEHRRGQSILGCILAGDYESFDTQRSRLWELYSSSGR